MNQLSHHIKPRNKVVQSFLSAILTNPFLLNTTRQQYRILVIATLTILLVAITLLSLGHGAVAISPAEILSMFLDQSGLKTIFDFGTEYEKTQEAVLFSIRMPRVLLCLIVGAGLAVTGATLQGLFRNPLADPTLIGVSSGAALAAVSVIVLGSTLFVDIQQILGIATLPLAAFAGGVIATWIVFRLGTRGGYTNPGTLLLAGIAINSIAGAGIGLLTYLADDEQLRTLTFWTMGSFGGTTWENVYSAAPWIFIATLMIPFHARALNALLLGEAEAGHLGFNLESIKRKLILLVALIVGASVAVTGIIGFVGLVVPHLLRLAIGPDYRLLLPGSALLGATLLLAADLLARTIVSPAELPIGIITAILGGPFFLWLLVSRKQRTLF